MDSTYTGSTAAYEDGNGTGLAPASGTPSLTHAWFIVVGSLVILWVLGRFVFRTVRI